MEDNVLTPYLWINGKHIIKDFSRNREHYLGGQENELENINEIEKGKINLDIEIVKMAIKSLKSNTSCGVGGVLVELLKAGTGKL